MPVSYSLAKFHKKAPLKTCTGHVAPPPTLEPKAPCGQFQ